MRNELKDCTVITSILTLNEFSVILMQLSKVLQCPELSISSAEEYISIAEEQIQAWAEFDCEQCGKIVAQAKAVCERFLIPFQEDMERKIYESFISPYVRHIKAQFELRFADLRKTLSNFRYIFPKNVNLNRLKDLKPLFQVSVLFKFLTFVQKYSEDLDAPQLLESEYMSWVIMWKKHGGRPNSIEEILDMTSAIAFPNMSKLIQICGVLPISNATAERSFSTLKLVKTALRSTMSENRLCGLIMLSVNSDLTIDFDELVTKFSNRL